MADLKKKRKDVRIPYDKELTLRTPEGDVVVGYAEDISRTGFFLRLGPVSRQLELMGRDVDLVMRVYEEEVLIPCRVVRAPKEGYGLEILE